MSGIAKTNAARLLDGLGIVYSLHSAPVDLDDLSAVTMAQSLHVAADIVFKTLVLKGDKHGVLMACIPAAAELDLKKLAAATGNKQVHMVPLKEVQGLTGYLRGGCSPLAAKKAYPVTIDENALLYEQIYVSAGQRGVQLCLAPDDLLVATQGHYADIIR
jgi:Cys-tRNA(Pro)/Cys-tRNA(Cys) deacylase